MKNIFNIFIFGVCLNFAGVVHAGDIVKWSLPQAQKPHEEFLLYRLSYSGFFTAFIWKDLADTVIVADNKSYMFNKQKSCQLNLKMSTENFLISELVLPMRFHWRATVSPDLSQVFLIEEINKNKDDSHEVVWLNQEKKRVEIYHKRKKIAVPATSDDNFYDDDDEDETKVMMWEKDGRKKAPDFLVNESGAEGGLNYLVYDKTVEIKNNIPVFDPLSLIYSVRWYDYDRIEKVDFIISHEDSFRKYQAHFEGKEKLEVGSKTVDTIRIEIRRNKEEARNGEGFMVMWLSDDERRIPLQYLVEVKSGTIKLKLNTSNLENYQVPVNCIDRKPVSVMTSIEGP
ncbi:MAG: hypothetical protein BMS9Abin19_0422 [Gammaproteobacteria bacterium]|nr:MAG: hypothetical protein BMS9Abin19_0422 [Gammaproteobacteria bacterium]